MIKLKRWDNGDTIHSGDFESIKECLEDAVKNGVDCRYANLKGAILDDASLDRAILDGASLNDANLKGASLDRANLNDASLSSTIKIQSKKRAYYKGSMFYCWFFGDIIKIGCRTHYYNEWKSFTNEQILEAENQEILDFWNKEKHIILAISESLQ